MKRIHINNERVKEILDTIAGVMVFILVLIIPSISIVMICYEPESKTEIKLDETYYLVAANVNNKTQTKEKLSGSFLLGIGEISGENKTEEKEIYKYWYKRSDGGILCKEINSRDPNITVVVYENDSIAPNVEVWRNESRFEEKIEYRFTIPSGSYVNMYDLQVAEK